MKLLRRFLFLLLGTLLLLVSIVLAITFGQVSLQRTVSPIQPIALSSQLAQHLSQALQLRTISKLDASQLDSSQFEQMNLLLQETYPWVDSMLEHHIFHRYAHLYIWQGSENQLPPIVLMGHLDVVPVPEENLSSWEREPFGGEIIDGNIWGRGAIDDKINVIGLMEAAEHLLQQGFQPKRTIYLAFGHDEEVGGTLGAQEICKYLESEGVRPDFVLDEGYTLTKGLVPGIEGRVGLIGIAEKGYCSVRLSTTIEGGHSSIPARETAIDVLAGAISKLNQHPFPRKVTYPVRAFIKHTGPEMPFVNKMAFGNYRLFKPLILNIYSQTNSGNALVRTTMAPTIFHSGIKDNVVPLHAQATINLRLLPGDTLELIMAHLKQHIQDDRIAYQPIQYQAPSPVSSDESWSYEQLDRTIKEVFPGTITSPNLVLGATDSRFFYSICDKVYRFAPYHLYPETLSMFHGINERIPVEDFENAVRFYVRLMQNMGENVDG